MNVRVKTVEAVMNTPELDCEMNKRGKIFNVILYDGWGMYPMNRYSGGEDEEEFLLGNIYEVLYNDINSTLDILWKRLVIGYDWYSKYCSGVIPSPNNLMRWTNVNISIGDCW